MSQPQISDPNRVDERESTRRGSDSDRVRDARHEIEEDRDANRDPLSGAPGAHPVGTGVGAAGGGATGAAIGAAAGPVGVVVGAAVGGVVGGLIGKGIAESANPTIEHEYWRENYANRPYVESGADYEDYGPAYQYGWESWSRYPDREFEEAEPELRRDWETYSHRSRNMTWDRAREAIRDAWNRMKQAGSGTAQRHDTGY